MAEGTGVHFTPDPNSKDKAADILGQLAGYSSLCWKETPTGEYDPESANKGVTAALAMLNQYFHLIPKGGNG